MAARPATFQAHIENTNRGEAVGKQRGSGAARALALEPEFETLAKIDCFYIVSCVNSVQTRTSMFESK